MKKFITMALVSAMVLAMGTGSISALETNSSDSSDVKAKYIDKSTTQDIYNIDVTWGAMEFTYTIDGDMTWDTENHKYDDNTTAEWTSTTNNVKVANHSNKDVVVGVDFYNQSKDEITGTFAYDTTDTDVSDGITLKSAVGVDYDNADKFTAKLTLAGDLSDPNNSSFNKIGAITVTVE